MIGRRTRMIELDKKQLIQEEQQIVDNLILTLEREIKDHDNRLQSILWNYRKAKEQGPEAYGVIVDAQNKKKDLLSGIQRARQSKDELYTCRLILMCDDGDGKKTEIELKIGLSTYMDKKKNLLVCEWKRDVCRHFLLDNCAEEFDGVVTDKDGKKHCTHYELKLKRNVDTKFSFVQDVTHLFPLTSEEAQQIIYDAFLSELASRRENTEFQNIIFSIQKKQGDIIKLPYDESIIVQGCAGSGKSMIMLHRLPILIYDNPDKLDSNNIYIISPSETYIQMVENMREELEITELKMGTINQYYDHVLSKYGIDLDVYGKVSYKTKVSKEQEDYIYSARLSKDIQKIAQELIKRKNYDFSEGLTTFELSQKESLTKTIDTQIFDYILTGNSIVVANNNVLKDYFMLCKSCMFSVKDLAEKTKNYRTSILRNIAKEISQQEAIITQRKKELEDPNLGEIAIQNRRNAIENAQKNIQECIAMRARVESDKSYFEKVRECGGVLEKLIDIFDRLKPQFEDNDRKELYSALDMRKVIYKGYRGYLHELNDIEWKYDKFSENLYLYARKYDAQIAEILKKNDLFLDLEYFEEILDTTTYYTKLRETIVQEIYLSIMEKCGQIPNEKAQIKGLSFSPYLYLKIMNEIKGATNISKEKLICIDEAQGLAPEEMKLIKDINGDNLIFNLYGDVKQHIEGTKGIDSWDEFKDSICVSEKFLMENYRNASQITEECNKRFGMKMEAINTPGSGVSVIDNPEDFNAKMQEVFLNIKKPGLRAIIVNDEQEARQVLLQYAVFRDKIHDMTGDAHDFHRTRWNLITVEQAKGLEFGTVVAISGRMSPNKKYIGYTRALDELYIYDEILDLDSRLMQAESKANKVDKKESVRSVIKEPKEQKTPSIVDYSQSAVRKYFESKGLEVHDMRSKGGALWVIGEQAKIKQYVDEACEKFGIAGAYSSGKATGFRPGCYFKTKK